MNLAKAILPLSIGLIISALLLNYTALNPNHLLYSGLLLAALSLLMLIFKTSNSEISSNSSEISGKVKWFNKTKGFGFITCSNGEDVFVHQTSIHSHPKLLREGQSVTLNVVMDKKGPQAENVRVA